MLPAAIARRPGRSFLDGALLPPHPRLTCSPARMEAVETVQAQAQEVAASHKAACGAFFNDIEVLSATASDYLALLSKHVRVRRSFHHSISHA